MSEHGTTPRQADMLEQIFAMQTSLNDHVFEKNKLTDAAGNILSMSAICRSVESNDLGANDLPNLWLSRYSQAMQAEIDELKDDLLWKWWSKDQIDLQNIRVELIDILHFLVSAMISAGLTPERVFDVYKQKHSINVARQDLGYSKATKTEDDNKSIE